MQWRMTSACLYRWKMRSGSPEWAMLEKIQQIYRRTSFPSVLNSYRMRFMRDYRVMTASTWLLLPAVMLERTQHASRLATFLVWASTFSNIARALYLSSSFVWSTLPVEIFPRILIEGIRRPMAGYQRCLIIRGITPLSTTTWILFRLASEWYDMAQQQSAIIYLSMIFPWAMARQRMGIAWRTLSYFGKGVPLQRLDRAQQQCLMRVQSVIFFATSTRLMSPPARKMVSLQKTQSDEMLPMAQMACSTMPILLDLSRSTNKGMPPLSMMLWHWMLEPEATFVSAQVASSWSWGYSDCLTKEIILGTRPASMTAWMGGFSAMERILRTPIIPQCWFTIFPSFMAVISSLKTSIEQWDFRNLHRNSGTLQYPCGSARPRRVIYLFSMSILPSLILDDSYAHSPGYSFSWKKSPLDYSCVFFQSPGPGAS